MFSIVSFKLTRKVIQIFSYLIKPNYKRVKYLYVWWQFNYTTKAIVSKIRNNCDFTKTVVRLEVDSDVMDAVYAGQIYPPGGGLSMICWYCTLTSLPSKVRFLSIYGITSVKIIVPWVVMLVLLVCWFIEGDINCVDRIN